MPGRTFLRRMIDLLCCFRNRDHPIRRVSSRFTGFRRDLQWWLSFFLEWDGVSLFLFPSISLLPDLVVPQMPLVRAVLVLCGAMSGFAVRGSSCPLLRSITSMELMSIVVAAHLWGSAWSRLRVQLLCNNLGVAHILNVGASKSSDVMHLLRSLTLACRRNFVFSATHTPGRVNLAADALSRLQLQTFRRIVPESNPLTRLIHPAFLPQLVTSPLISKCFDILAQ
jgi:hypothetical protein